MKKFLFFAFVLCYGLVAFSQVRLSGKISNFPPGSEIRLTCDNNPIEYDEITLARANPDSSGYFYFNFTIPQPIRARLYIAGQYTDLFLMMNDSMHMIADYDRLDEVLHYQGQGSANNNYMAADQRMKFNSKANTYYLYTDADKYTVYMDSLENNNREFLLSHYDPGFTIEFRKYITATTKYRYVNPRWMFLISFNNKDRKFSEKTLPLEYFDFLKKIDLNDQDAASNSNYDIALMRYLFEFYDRDEWKKVPDSLDKIHALEQGLTKIYENRKKLFKEQVLDYQLTYFMKLNIVNVLEDSAFSTVLLNDYRHNCKNPEYIAIIDRVVSNEKNLLAEKPAPDFTATDMNGQTVSLSSLKGNLVFVDFWATWCVPCIASLPETAALAEKLKSRRDVAVLLVNVKDQQDKWEHYLAKNKPTGINLYADKLQSDYIYKAYNFNGIPHYLLIGPNGRIISSTLSGPADAEKLISQKKL